MTATGAKAGQPLTAAVILLALGTAITHLYLGLQLTSFGGYGLGVLFILNFLGYVGLTALLYLPIRGLEPYRGVIRYALITFAALTIALWIPFGTKDVLGYVNKLNELLLIATLIAEARLARSA